MVDIVHQLTEDVWSLHISMDEALIVKELECPGNASQNVEVVGLDELVALRAVPELLQGPPTELHDEVAIWRTDLDVIESNDVLVLELQLDFKLLGQVVVAVGDFLSVDFLEGNPKTVFNGRKGNKSSLLLKLGMT